MARSEAQAMLRVARRDLRAARLLAVDEADEASWGFQMQQAIEKAFKAWILSSDLRAPFTHDIADLLQLPQSERLALAIALWDSLGDEARDGALPGDPDLCGAAVTWAEVRSQLGIG